VLTNGAFTLVQQDADLGSAQIVSIAKREKLLLERWELLDMLVELAIDLVLEHDLFRFIVAREHFRKEIDIDMLAMLRFPINIDQFILRDPF
jgi:hypothetical protein